jgi:hypothetical protein
VFKPFSGILGKVGKTKEAVKNCLKMVRVTMKNGLNTAPLVVC